MPRTEFNALRDHLETGVYRLPPRRKGLFLLAYAQRFAHVFSKFEARAGARQYRFEHVLENLWALAVDSEVSPGAAQSLLELIPGEDWVVDGFHDALAQYVGGLALGALQSMTEPCSVQGRPERGVFDLLRMLLSEMRLGCLEPDDVSFDSELHMEQLVIEEADFWRELLDRLVGAAGADQVRDFVMSRVFDTSKLEPDLTRGLQLDGLNAR